MKFILLIIFFLFLIACQRESISWEKINSVVTNKFSDVEHITIQDFVAETEDNDVIIVDVREPEEYKVSHIPGAINLTDVSEIAELARDMDKDVIVYCSVGYRSAEVAQKLKAAGIHDVANFQGSIFAWANADMPLVNNNGATKVVHPYDEYWGQLLDDDVLQRIKLN